MLVCYFYCVTIIIPCCLDGNHTIINNDSSTTTTTLTVRFFPHLTICLNGVFVYFFVSHFVSDIVFEELSKCWILTEYKTYLVGPSLDNSMTFERRQCFIIHILMLLGKAAQTMWKVGIDHVHQHLALPVCLNHWCCCHCS